MPSSTAASLYSDHRAKPLFWSDLVIKRSTLLVLACAAAMSLNGCGPSASAPTSPQEVALAVVHHLGANPPAKDASPYLWEKAATIPTGMPAARADELAGLTLDQVVFFTRSDIARLRIDHPSAGWDALERGMSDGLGCLWVRHDRQRRHRDVLVVGSVEGQSRVIARADLGWGPLVTPPPQPVTIIPPQATAAAKKVLQAQVASKLADRRLVVSVAKTGGTRKELTESQRSQLQKLVSEGIASGEFNFGRGMPGGGPGSPPLPAPWATVEVKSPAKAGAPESTALVDVIFDATTQTTIVRSTDRDLEGYAYFSPAAIQQWVEDRLKGVTSAPPKQPEGAQVVKPLQAAPQKSTPTKKSTKKSKKRRH